MTPTNSTAITGRMILILALTLGATTLHAQTQQPVDRVDNTGQHAAEEHITDEPVTDATNLTHSVDFHLGEIRLAPGDDIRIESVVGSSSTIAPGNVYLVTGTYKLASHPTATLSTNVTTTTRGMGATRNRDPATQPRNTPIQQGEGHFKVYLHMPGDGYPHLSFYPTQGGASFASVYFGTGDSVMLPRTASK